MKIQKQVIKKEWQQPRLITLSKAKLGESVLVACGPPSTPGGQGYPSSGYNG